MVRAMRFSERISAQAGLILQGDVGKVESENMGYGDRDRSGGGFGGPREMHQAKCSDCGKDCEVPFKPTEGRPVYCRDCFQKHRPPRKF
jgi:CxxC-x17-CxxC domain-containing protein